MSRRFRIPGLEIATVQRWDGSRRWVVRPFWRKFAHAEVSLWRAVRSAFGRQR